MIRRNVQYENLQKVKLKRLELKECTINLKPNLTDQDTKLTIHHSLVKERDYMFLHSPWIAT